MKIILTITGIIVVVISAIFVYDMFLSEVQTLTVEKEINAPIQTVWTVMTTWEDQPKWRTDVDRVEVISSTEFIEYPKHGQEITFKVLEFNEPSKLTLQMESSFTGIYDVLLIEQGNTTKIIESYELTYASPIGRIFATHFFSLEDFANDYLASLAKYAEAKQ